MIFLWVAAKRNRQK